MIDFRRILGFQDNWRTPSPPARYERPAEPAFTRGTRAKLRRVLNRTPEVVVRVSAGLRAGAGIRRHLDYISRHGALELETPDGLRVGGPAAVRELAQDWTWSADMDREGAANGPVARALVLSFPKGPEPDKVEAAARRFGQWAFGDRFDYVFVRHDDGAHPHIHMTVRALGWDGERLTPRIPDLYRWRVGFAQALREQGVEAEASSRLMRGQLQRFERAEIHHIRQRHERGEGPRPERDVRLEAEARLHIRRTVHHSDTVEARLEGRRDWTEKTYRDFLRRLAASPLAEERGLVPQVRSFIADLPQVYSRRDSLADRRHSQDLRRAMERQREQGDRELTR